MTIKLKYNNNQQILAMKATGVVSVLEIEANMIKLFNSNEFPADVNSLWDIRDMSFENIDMAFIKQVVALRKKYNTKRGNAKIAILSGSLLVIPLVKLYLILSKKLTQKTRAFLSEEEAMEWLAKKNSLLSDVI